MRQLDKQAAEAASRPDDQHPLARADLGRRGQAKRGRAVMEQRRRLAQAEACWDRDQHLRLSHRLGGVAAPAAEFAGVAGDTLADPASCVPTLAM